MSGIVNKLKGMVSGDNTENTQLGTNAPYNNNQSTGNTTGNESMFGGSSGTRTGPSGAGYDSGRVGNVAGGTDQHSRERHLEEAGAVGAVGAGIAAEEHHHHNKERNEYDSNTGSGLTGSRNDYDSNTGSGLTGSRNDYDSNTNTGSGLTGSRNDYDSNTGSGLTGSGNNYDSNTGSGTGRHLGRAEAEALIEPHQIAGENIEDFTTPSTFAHGKHHGSEKLLFAEEESGRNSGSTGLGSGTTGYGSGNTGRDTYDEGRTGGNTGMGSNSNRSGEYGSTGQGQSTGFGSLDNSGSGIGRSSGNVDMSRENERNQDGFGGNVGSNVQDGSAAPAGGVTGGGMRGTI